MDLGEIPSYLQERFQALKGQLFPLRLRLEISDQGLRGVRLGRRGEAPTLVFSVPLPEGICLAGQPQQLPALGDFIGDLLLEHGLVTAQVSAVLPAEACWWRVISWPFEEPPDDPVEALRQLDPELQLAGPLDGWILTYEHLKKDGPGGGAQSPVADTVLAAAPRSLVQAWQEVFGLAGINLQQLIPAQLQDWHALARATEGERWFLALGPQASRLWLVVDGEPKADWPLSGGTLSGGTLSRGIPANSSDRHWQVAIQRCREFWRAQRGALGQAHWCCYGPGSDDPLLRTDLQAFLDPCPVTWLEPDFIATSTATADLLRELGPAPGQSSSTSGDWQAGARKGLWAGAGLVAAMLLAWGGLIFLCERNRAELESLEPVQSQSEFYQGKLQRLQQQLAQLNQGNGALAAGLVAVQSGSALLAEFRQLTPVGVQLTSLKLEPGLVRIQGLAGDPQAFARINAFELGLQGSGLFGGDGLKLIKASREAAEGAAAGAAVPVQFEITAPLAKKPVPLSVGQLRALGSVGMAERQQFLRNEGLLP